MQVESERLQRYWSQAPQALLAGLKSSPTGLTTAEAARRLAQVGPNALHARTHTGPLQLLLGQFTNPITLILLAATAVSAVLGDWVDAVIILAIVLVSAVLSFLQEHRAGNAAAKLRAQVQVQATVLRDGRPQAIPATQVVPGDVVVLAAGSLIPADGILLEAHDLFVTQAALTGETFPVRKQPGTVSPEASLAERTNCVLMGTSVRSGSGQALIVQTGPATAFGQIAGRLALRPPETDFERGIRRFGALLSEVTLLLVLAVFAINVFFRQPVLDSLLFALALAVGLTPQLLPAIININLSRGSQAMATRGVIVRRLAAIENFGSMDVLCTDKTGTLTAGVVRLDQALDVQGQASARVLQEAMLNAHFQTGLANPLDEAILAQGTVDLAHWRKVDEVPYDFVRKRLSVVVQQDDHRCLVTKGALEDVLAVCTHVRDGAAVAPLDAVRRAAIQQQFATWSAQGFRVLGVATRAVDAQAAYSVADEHDLIFSGFLLFFDPPKPDARATIAGLAALGVQLKIITGDNRLVAAHVAETLGLDPQRIVTGHDLNTLRDEALWHVADRALLFAEVDPNQKDRIIQALRRTGHVVGYMGDGINDAPALHSADVGISVDTAVDVARDAADFVLLQKDLGVLQAGIAEGRRTFANTLKYVFMATSANFGNMFSVAGAALILPFLPMLPKQILLINMLTDLPEMTIASDRVDAEVVAKPQRWDIAFIRRFMVVFGLLSSIFDYLTFTLLYWLLRSSPAQFHTGWFVESVVSATLVVFVVRTRLPLTRSRPSRLMLQVTALVVLVTLALPFSPLASLLGFTVLPVGYLGAVAVIVAGYVGAAEVTKRLFYRVSAQRPGPARQQAPRAGQIPRDVA